MSRARSLVADGCNAADYDWTLSLSHRDWAWEFLRRDPSFRVACAAAQSGVSERKRAHVSILQLRRTAPSLADWGLIYRGFAA